MQGPIPVSRATTLEPLTLLNPVYEWTEGASYLLVDRVRYQDRTGVVFTYHNPPVHQMGNPALDAYLGAFSEVERLGEGLSFLILTGTADPVHAGGDLKESLARLRQTRATAAEREAAGDAPAEIDALFRWADARIEKGFALYLAVRRASERLRTVAVCGGGTRFGGSAEVPLLADHRVADTRAALCFSEAQIGLIPGWGGVGRAVSLAGWENAYAMAATCAVVPASDLHRVGLVDRLVEIPEPFPRKERTGDKEADKKAHEAALWEHDARVSPVLLQAALDLAVAPDAPARHAPAPLLDPDAVRQEVRRRSDPTTYAELWGRPLRDVREELRRLGKPLAPQSVEALDELFATLPAGSFDEERFIHAEGRADGALYRDPRLERGIVATLEQRVADFRKDEP